MRSVKWKKCRVSARRKKLALTQCNAIYVSTSGTFCTLLFSHANAATGDSGFRLSVQMQTIDLCNIKLHLMRERAHLRWQGNQLACRARIDSIERKPVSSNKSLANLHALRRRRERWLACAFRNQ
jgi:hypothetical protein